MSSSKILRFLKGFLPGFLSRFCPGESHEIPSEDSTVSLNNPLGSSRDPTGVLSGIPPGVYSVIFSDTAVESCFF